MDTTKIEAETLVARTEGRSLTVDPDTFFEGTLPLLSVLHFFDRVFEKGWFRLPKKNLSTARFLERFGAVKVHRIDGPRFPFYFVSITAEGEGYFQALQTKADNRYH